MWKADPFSRLKVLQAVEEELKRIGEWKPTRSIDLDWHLPLEEYLQFVIIPTMRANLDKREIPQWPEAIRPSIAIDWHRSHRFKKVAELILTDQGAPPVQFCSPLTNEEFTLLKRGFDDLFLEFEKLKSNFNLKQRELHEAFLMRLDVHLSHHQKHLYHKEPPPILPKDLLLYFDVVDEVPEAVAIGESMKSYQALLETNADNSRIALAEKELKIEIEIVLPQPEIAEKFKDAYQKIGEKLKLKGFKVGTAPLESIRRDPIAEKRAKDSLLEPLMKEAFDRHWLKNQPAGNEERPPYASFQPLCRLSESSDFKFLATLDRHR